MPSTTAFGPCGHRDVPWELADPLKSIIVDQSTESRAMTTIIAVLWGSQLELWEAISC